MQLPSPTTRQGPGWRGARGNGRPAADRADGWGEGLPPDREALGYDAANNVALRGQWGTSRLARGKGWAPGTTRFGVAWEGGWSNKRAPYKVLAVGGRAGARGAAATMRTSARSGPVACAMMTNEMITTQCIVKVFITRTE